MTGDSADEARADEATTGSADAPVGEATVEAPPEPSPAPAGSPSGESRRSRRRKVHPGLPRRHRSLRKKVRRYRLALIGACALFFALSLFTMVSSMWSARRVRHLESELALVRESREEARRAVVALTARVAELEGPAAGEDADEDAGERTNPMNDATDSASP